MWFLIFFRFVLHLSTCKNKSSLIHIHVSVLKNIHVSVLIHIRVYVYIYWYIHVTVWKHFIVYVSFLTNKNNECHTFFACKYNKLWRGGYHKKDLILTRNSKIEELSNIKKYIKKHWPDIHRHYLRNRFLSQTAEIIFILFRDFKT